MSDNVEPELLRVRFSLSFFMAPSDRRGVILGLLAVWMVGYGVLGGAAVFTGDLKSLFAVAVSVVAALVALRAADHHS